MSSKRIAQWVVVTVTVGLTGCCHWCERHCSAPAPTCCQPAYQAAPVYQPAPACCAPQATYPAPQATYPAPVGYQPSYSPQWRPAAGANGCCE
jgi:hypothetical protein